MLSYRNILAAAHRVPASSRPHFIRLQCRLLSNIQRKAARKAQAQSPRVVSGVLPFLS